MNIDEILDVIDELLDRAWSLPLSGGRCVVDADKVRDLIDDIRLNIPGEIKQAKAIVSDRAEIIDGAKKRGGTDRAQGRGPRPRADRTAGGHEGRSGQGV